MLQRSLQLVLSGRNVDPHLGNARRIFFGDHRKRLERFSVQPKRQQQRLMATAHRGPHIIIAFNRKWMFCVEIAFGRLFARHLLVVNPFARGLGRRICHNALPRDFFRRGQILFHQHGGQREHVADVVETVA